MVAADIYRECYPKIEVEAYGIELQLYEDEGKQQFVIINMTDEIRKKYMKEAINLMLTGADDSRITVAERKCDI